MLKVINTIDIKRFIAVIINNESNIIAVYRLITIQFSRIFNIKCILYYLNLILYNFLQYNFIDKIIKYYNILVKYF